MYLETMQLESKTAKSLTSLSTLTRHSWDDSQFFINYAARKGSAFDLLYWNCIDPLLFGKNTIGGHEGRLSLLSDNEKELMELFVQMKVEHDGDLKILEWEAEVAHEVMQDCLGLGQEESAVLLEPTAES